jgi:chromate transporter
MDEVGLVEIFSLLVLSALFSFGGGNGQIPLIQGRWVDPGILDPGLFSFALAVTYLTPGPKAGFIAAVGYYLAGPPGAVAAVAGLVVPTCLGAGGVSYAMRGMQRLVTFVKPAAGFVIAALIAAAAWGTAIPMRFGAYEWIGVAVATALVGWRNIDPLLLVIGAVVIGLALSVVPNLS